MSGQTAGLLFVGVCIVLAILLLTSSVSFVLSGCIFAVALVLLGGLSRGFRRGADGDRQGSD